MGAIELENVSIWRRTQEELTYDLKRIILQSLEGRYRRPTRRQILRNIDLSVETGEKVGIVGANGAGKSTLLKVISGILRPTRGRVTVRGRIAPLIELGAGFDPDLSVIENVIYYGVLLGFSRDLMRSRVPAILEFAELEEYGRAPLKTLSSGMAARLGFAVATDQRPDIFILDEVLSVGDARFKHKSTERLKEFWDAHSTILVVSHDTDFIASQCERAIWIQDGAIVASGPAARVTSEYLDSVEAGFLNGNVNYGLDRITHGEISLALDGGHTPATIKIAAGDTVTIEGWAADIEARRAAQGVIFEVGTYSASADCTVVRPDVEDAYGAAEMRWSGYCATLSTGSLEEGLHSVALRVVTDQGDSYRVPTVLRLQVASE